MPSWCNSFPPLYYDEKFSVQSLGGSRHCFSSSHLFRKPRYLKPHSVPLIKATQPFERLSINFEGPLPSAYRNYYLLTVTDEYSRFPFAFPCRNMETRTVIRCLNKLFTTFGLPSYIHSDRGKCLHLKSLLVT